MQKYRYSSNLVLDGTILPSNMLDVYKTGSANDINLLTGVVSQNAVLFSFLPKSDNIPFYMPMIAVSKEDDISIVKKVFGNLADKALEVYPANSFECIDKYNEINQDATIALQNFVGKARELKSTKPSPLNQLTDLLGYNLYYGWYYKEMQDLAKRLDEFHKARPDIPVLISEYGVDTNPQYHSYNPTVRDYTEEYHCFSMKMT